IADTLLLLAPWPSKNLTIWKRPRLAAQRNALLRPFRCRPRISAPWVSSSRSSSMRASSVFSGTCVVSSTDLPRSSW
ncbi:TPA: hypothetical protein N0F65_007041, partial [Lagenidium giganteum]